MRRPWHFRWVVNLCLFVGLFACGCGQAPADPLAGRFGDQCTVQFRRGDALGGGADLPVSPTTGSINGAQVSLTGILRGASDGWLLIRRDQTDFLIPRDAVLLLQFASKD